MNQQHTRTLQEMRTSLPGDRVLAAAKDFFANRPSLYSAFIEQESATHVSMRGQGGEEVIIGVRPVPEGTAVTGSSYLFDMQIQRFFASLPPAPEAPAVPESATEPAMEEAAAAGGAPVA